VTLGAQITDLPVAVNLAYLAVYDALFLSLYVFLAPRALEG
jgi:hypothetical protein